MLSVACCQHVGQAGFNQQDALLLGHEVWQARDLSVERAFKASGTLLAVADGVSASPAAERASRLALALFNCLIADSEETDFELHLQEARISPGDYVLLMTDGVHDVLPLAALQASFDPALGVRQQVERWRVAVLAAGSPDNFSLILARRD